VFLAIAVDNLADADALNENDEAKDDGLEPADNDDVDYQVRSAADGVARMDPRDALAHRCGRSV